MPLKFALKTMRSKTLQSTLKTPVTYVTGSPLVS